MKTKSVELLAPLVCVVTVANAFVTRPLATRNILSFSHNCRNSLSYSMNDEHDGLNQNVARTCVKNFLTQRSVQSFMFLCDQCRDPHTVKWLQDVYGWKNLLNFHGTGAFNLTIYETWDSILNDMMTRPADTVIVSARRRGRGRGGWSRDNPYLEDRFVEFEIDIDPVSLASRIMSVREQLAAEWEQDFETIINANEQIVTSYFQNMMDARQGEDEFDPAQDYENTLDEASLTAPYSSQTGRTEKAFDRNAMQMLLDDTAFEPLKSSPLRKGNFDLMILLATQESIHRVLRELKAEDRDVSFEWLLGFYSDRLPGFFDGNQHYGRADDFLEELMLTPPSVTKEDGKMGLIDPLGIAERIIRMRGKVSREWKEQMSFVPQEHMQLRKQLLAYQMGRAIAPLESKFDRKDVGGEFE